MGWEEAADWEEEAADWEEEETAKAIPQVAAPEEELVATELGGWVTAADWEEAPAEATGRRRRGSK